MDLVLDATMLLAETDDNKQCCERDPFTSVRCKSDGKRNGSLLGQ